MDRSIYDLLRQLQKDPDYKNIQYDVVNEYFENIKEELIQEFENHPVTQEISQGVNGSNISDTLPNLNANLYEFIGFESKDGNPLAPIRKLFASMKMKIIYAGNSEKAIVNITAPTAQNIFDVTPMPWPGFSERSWAEGIELGISGINYFLLGPKEKSRSGGGLQSKYRVRSDFRFKNRPYISQMIREFNRKVNNLDKMIL